MKKVITAVFDGEVLRPNMPLELEQNKSYTIAINVEEEVNVKGIKRGRNIEIFEDIDIPDGEEITIAIERKGSFWQSLKRFREELNSEEIWIEPEVFEGVRDFSPGKDVIL